MPPFHVGRASSLPALATVPEAALELRSVFTPSTCDASSFKAAGPVPTAVKVLEPLEAGPSSCCPELPEVAPVAWSLAMSSYLSSCSARLRRFATPERMALTGAPFLPASHNFL